jgi:hypothetical protein
MTGFQRSYYPGVAILIFCGAACSTEPPPKVQEVLEPEEELAMEEPMDNYIEEYIPPPEEIPPPPPVAPPAKPSWVYGYQSGFFSGNEYTPGTYNFGSAASKGMQVFYSRQCDCVYARNDGKIIGIVQVGDHLLVIPHNREGSISAINDTAERNPVLISQDGSRLVQIQDGALILPRALMQDPIPRSQRENTWR